MNLVSHLTHSRMMTYEQCPKKYFYEYILRLTPEPTYPNYGDLGSRAHKVLEDFYTNITIPCNPENHFDDFIGRLYIYEFLEIDDYKRNMLTGLLNFLEIEIGRYNELEDKNLFVPKYSELYLKSRIDNVPFSGRVDAIYQNENGKLTAVDYKFTSKNSIGNEQKQQAAIYCILLKNELGITFDTFDFWFLRHKKQTIKSVKINEKLINSVTQNVNKVLQQISEMQFSRKRSWLCRYCGYEGICLSEQAEGM